jgi:hypothetical protein
MKLAVTDDEVMVRLRVQHIPLHSNGVIHTTYSEWRPLGQPFSLNTQSFGNVIQVALRYGSPDAPSIPKTAVQEEGSVSSTSEPER